MGCSPSHSRVGPETINKEQPPIKPAKEKEKSSEEESYHNSQRSQCSFGSLIEQNGGVQIFEWEFGKEIGKGTMSHVYTVTNVETHAQCAAKVYNKSLLLKPTLGSTEVPFDNVKREIQIMAEVTHCHVLQIDEVIEDDFSDSFILLMPCAPFGTLTKYTVGHPMSEEEMQLCFLQIASALCHIHSLNIVHRDIKPENILVFAENLFKLSDFSESTKLQTEDEKLLDTKGSPPFLSPEECSGEPFDPKPADVWAYGMSIYKMIFGYLPFELNINQGRTIANTIFSVMMLLEKEELKFPGGSEELRDLLTKLLDKNPLNRPAFEDIMKHTWFKEVAHKLCL